MAYHNRGYYRSRSQNYGSQKARQHIEEAAAFSREVGGTDRDVKKYFFSLNGEQMDRILHIYGQKYGLDKESYAREALPLWASGKRKMSGLVAKRLFSLLPNYMPVSAKFNLVESLWKHSSPNSRESIRLDSRTAIPEVKQKVSSHFKDKLSHQIPDNFTRRFNWLAGNDSIVKQQLLNHFRKLELSVVENSLEPKLATLCSSLERENRAYISGSHSVIIGKHELEIQFDNSAAIAERRAAEKQRRQEAIAKFTKEILLPTLIGIFLIFVVFLLATN